MPLAFNSPVSFDKPEWLWLLVAIPVIVLIAHRSLAGLERGRRALALVMRSLVILMLAVVLARVHYVKRNDSVAVMVVLDRSRSIPDELRERARDYVRQLGEASYFKKFANPEDRLGLVGFDAVADVDLIPSRGPLKVIPFSMAEQADRTDIASGIRLAMAAFPPGYARRIVILTDGNQNMGDLKEEIATAEANGITIDVVPLRFKYDSEILFDRLSVPAHASRDTAIPVKVIARSQRPTRAKLTLLHNGAEVPLRNPVITLTGNMQADRFDFPVELFSGGIHFFEGVLTPLGEQDDVITENNRATAFTFVTSQGRVLILVPRDFSDDQVMYDSLRREKIDAEMRSVDDLTINPLTLREYDTVLLANIPADVFTAEQHKALAGYVRDYGGGLIMTGGDESFGAGGWIGTPVEEISPVFFEVKHKQVMPQGALAIVMHTCEIDKGNYWGEQVAIASVNAISSLDYLGVIAYAWDKGVNWEVPLAPATNKPAIINVIKGMKIGDMPDFAVTMQIAVNDLMALPNVSQRHMIIISDGDPQPPSAATINRMVANKITCSTVGIGFGVHVMEQTLKDIARKTGGRYYACKNSSQLPQIFVKETKVVKRSLLEEEDFQPQVAGFSQVLEGIREQVPVLGGLVLTTPKPDITMPLFRATTDGNDPVLAYWPNGMGKMAVFTSGWWPRWGARWAAWPAFSKFWAQLIRWSLRQSGSADFDVMTRLDGNTGRVVVEALNKDARYLNFMRLKGNVTGPDAEPREIFPVQTGPGRYEATFPVGMHGNYLIDMRYEYDEDTGGAGKTVGGMINTGLSLPFSPEFRELGYNPALLEEARERTSGRELVMDTARDDVFNKANLPVVVDRRPVWRWVLGWLLLPLFLLDVAARRLASRVAFSVYVELAVLAFMWAVMYTLHAGLWGYVGALVLAVLIGWTIRWRSIVPAIEFFTSGGRALAGAGQRGAQSVSQLKGVREKVREGFTGEPSTQERRGGTVPLEAPADKRRRFDLGEKAGDKAAGDLSKELGGAEPEDPSRPKPRPTPGQPGQDMTSRLRRAKRRARDEMEDRGGDEDKS